jgi:hypothetical protein
VKLIFLDIDGVLNSERHAIKMHGEGLRGGQTYAQFDPECVKALNRICDETGAVCILSSTWRINWTIPGMLMHLQKFGFTGQLLDKTPLTSHERGFEIAMYLGFCHSHGPTVESFVILDDDSDMAQVMSFLVKTSFKTGLTEADADKAIEMLAQTIDLNPPEGTPLIWMP